MEQKPRFVWLVAGSEEAVEQRHCDIIRTTMIKVASKYPRDKWSVEMVYGDRRGAVAYAVTLCKVMEFINSGFIVKDPKTGNFSPSRFIDHAVRQRDAGARVGIVTFQMENDEQTREVTRLAKEAGFGVMEIPC